MVLVGIGSGQRPGWSCSYFSSTPTIQNRRYCRGRCDFVQKDVRGRSLSFSSPLLRISSRPLRIESNRLHLFGIPRCYRTWCWPILFLFDPSLSLRVFSDPANEETMWKASVKDIDGEILCVSQFTLMANTTKGNKPDFHRAMVGLSRVHFLQVNLPRGYSGYGTFP